MQDQSAGQGKDEELQGNRRKSVVVGRKWNVNLYHSHTGIYKEKHVLDFSHLSEALNVVLYPNFGPVLEAECRTEAIQKKKKKKST